MERRDFLIKSTYVAAAAGLGLWGCSTKVTPKFIPDTDRIRVGIIGMGDRGSFIIKVLNKLPEVKIIACCDILDFRLAEGLKNIKGKATAYSDYKKLLENKELDAVIISTPLHEHFRMVMDALDAGLHIMCEKALAYDIEQSKTIKNKAEKTNKQFQVSYQYQLNPVFNAIKETIEQGHIGKLVRIDAMWNRNHDWRRKVPKGYSDRQINWRLYKEYSGGLLAELGSHQLNMIDNIIGDHPEKVVGTGGIDYWKDGREIFDNVFALFDYPNGIKASFSSIMANKFEGQSIKFYGDKGSILSKRMNEAYIYPEGNTGSLWNETMDGVTGASFKIIDKSKARQITPKLNIDDNCPFSGNYERTTWLLYKNFAAAIKGEEKLKLGLEDGYQSAISVHLANQAIREDKVMRWLPEYNV